MLEPEVPVTLFIETIAAPVLDVRMLGLRGDVGPPGPVQEWGNIPGDLEDQTDLWDALTGKAAFSHSHTLGNLTQSGATTGQVIAWNGTAWAPADVVGGGGGAGVWGAITGTLSAQTDLQAALDGKAATSHTHAISDTTGLQTALDGKAPVIAVSTKSSAYSVADADLTGASLHLVSFGSAANITVGTGLTGTQPLTVAWTGTGQPSFVASGTTIVSADSRLKLRAVGSVATLVRTGTNTFLLFGDLAT